MVHGFNAPKQINDWLKTAELNRQHELRSNAKMLINCDRSNSKFGDLRFKNIFSKFLNKINFYNLDKNIIKFRSELSGN